MKARATGFLLAMAGVGLIEYASLVSAAFGQQTKPSAQADYPTFFKVYSKDGRESLTATCTPTERKPVIIQVTCSVVNVRVLPPDQRPDTPNIPLSVEEALKVPQLAPEVKKDPKRFELEMKNSLEKMKRDFCSPSSKERAAFETSMRDPELGAKWRAYYQQVIAACADEDPRVLFRRLGDADRRTCGLWVDRFTFSLERARQGQWFYRQKAPGLLSKVLKVYELTGAGVLWTLSETRVPTEGSTEKPSQTVWSWKNIGAYELPCDFISHDLVQAPESWR